jgi:hypothetical protein
MLTSTNNAEEIRQWIAAMESDVARWVPVGGINNNTGAIDLGSDPSDSLNERITNAIDAVLEREWREFHLSEATPGSPREAAEKWFHIPKGQLASLGQAERRKLADNIVVTLLESGLEKLPTVLVKDVGVGQHPSDFPSTLLSLHEENKIDKHFLMGAYGQGGASVYSFCEYTIIASRRVPSLLGPGQEDRVGWTIVRYNPLDAEHKNGRYEYLVLSDGSVGSINPDAGSAHFEPGTQIRMIQYQLPKHFTIFTAPSSSLWALTNSVLYDPVLPFIIRDERLKRFKSLEQYSPVQRTRVIIGNANRLREKKAKKAIAEETGDTEKVELRYDEEHKVNLGEYGTARIRYWIFNFPKGESKKAPVDAYADTQSSIAVTLNGQRQAKFDRTYFRTSLNLPILKDYMLVQIDCDELTKLGKKELLSSTRDRPKQTTLLDRLLEDMNDIISKDPQVKKIAIELQEAALRSASTAENIRLSRQLEQLIRNWELKDKALTEIRMRMLPNEEGNLTAQPFHRDEAVDVDEDEDEPIERNPPEPLTWTGKYFPTTFDFVASQEPLRIPINKAYTIRLMSDAQDDCLSREHDRGELSLTFIASDLVIERSRGEMRSGRVSVRVITTEAATPEKKVSITAKLTFPGRVPMSVTRRALLVATRKGSRKAVEAEGPPKYQIVPVTKEGEHWVTDKKDEVDFLGWTEQSVASVDPSSGKTIYIYVNLSNRDYTEEIRKRTLGDETIERYSNRYRVAIAFHAYLQYHSIKDLHDSGKSVPSEDTLQSELARTVRTVIYTTFVSPQQDVLATV